MTVSPPTGGGGFSTDLTHYPEIDYRPEISGVQRFPALHPLGEKRKTGKIPLTGHSDGFI
jgi:hypothetical protein